MAASKTPSEMLEDQADAMRDPILPGLICLSCGACIAGQLACTPESRPVPGALCMCSYCDALMIFTGELQLRLVTPTQFKQLNAATRDLIRRVRAAVRAARADVARKKAAS